MQSKLRNNKHRLKNSEISGNKVQNHEVSDSDTKSVTTEETLVEFTTWETTAGLPNPKPTILEYQNLKEFHNTLKLKYQTILNYQKANIELQETL